jgi:hypothetical protein
MEELYERADRVTPQSLKKAKKFADLARLVKDGAVADAKEGNLEQLLTRLWAIANIEKIASAEPSVEVADVLELKNDKKVAVKALETITPIVKANVHRRREECMSSKRELSQRKKEEALRYRDSGDKLRALDAFKSYEQLEAEIRDLEKKSMAENSKADSAKAAVRDWARDFGLLEPLQEAGVDSAETIEGALAWCKRNQAKDLMEILEAGELLKELLASMNLAAVPCSRLKRALELRAVEHGITPRDGECHQLLIFACSPTLSPLKAAGGEASDVAMATSWGDGVKICWGGDAEKLRSQLLKARPYRFLFSGHADAPLFNGEKTLCFTKPGGTAEAVDPKLLCDIMAKHATGNGGVLELVFLNGCDSHKLGQSLHEAGVPTGVCWQSKVHDEAAAIFSQKFFQAVALKQTYQEAFDEAKRAVLLATQQKRGALFATAKFELRDPEDNQQQGAGVPLAAGVPLLLSKDEHV